MRYVFGVMSYYVRSFVVLKLYVGESICKGYRDLEKDVRGILVVVVFSLGSRYVSVEVFETIRFS